MAAEMFCTSIKVFVVMIVVGGMFIFLFLFMFNLIYPPFPRSELTEFFVSNVNISFPGFTMKWDVKVKLTNPSSKVPVKFNEIKSSVFCENNYLVSGTFVQPFTLKAGRSKEMEIKLSAKDTDLGELGEWIVENIAREKASNGTVTFGLSMVFPMKRRFGLLKEHAELRLYCQSIRVVLGNTSQGSADTSSCWSVLF